MMNQSCCHRWFPASTIDIYWGRLSDRMDLRFKLYCLVWWLNEWEIGRKIWFSTNFKSMPEKEWLCCQKPKRFLNDEQNWHIYLQAWIIYQSLMRRPDNRNKRMNGYIGLMQNTFRSELVSLALKYGFSNYALIHKRQWNA